MSRAKIPHHSVTLLYHRVPKPSKMFSFFQLSVSSSVTCSGNGGRVSRLTATQVTAQKSQLMNA